MDIGGDKAMPYIDGERRKDFDQDIGRLVAKLEGLSGWQSGEVNYCLSKIIWNLWEMTPNYSMGNSLVGVLECAKQEFYRRMLAPYEDKVQMCNGDIV
jgi:hypothetical protein